MSDSTPEHPLLERMRLLAAEFSGELTGPAGDRFRRITQRLEEPLRLAVAGQVKAGKSTLVNALLRQVVAPTDVSECTQVVTWFRYGLPERVELRLRPREGLAVDRVELQLEPDGTLPRELPVAPPEIESLQVFLANEQLKRMTVIDTPGLGSLNRELSASSRELLAMERSSREAAGAADALALVINQAVSQEDLSMLQGWSGAAPADPAGRPGLQTANSAVNAIGILSKADKLGDGRGDPWPRARELAGRQSEQISDHVAAVVPVIGLLAETVYASGLTAPEAHDLETLAGLDSTLRARMLLTPDLFLRADCELPVPSRQRLLSRLDLFGLRYAVARIEAGATGAIALGEELGRASGFAALDHTVTESFFARRDVLLVRSVLAALEDLTFDGHDPGDRPALAELRAQIETIRNREPATHELAELSALHESLTGEVTLPAALKQDLERLAGARDPVVRLGAPDGDPVTLREAALAGHVRWKHFKSEGPPPEQERIADIVIRSYTLAYKLYR